MQKYLTTVSGAGHLPLADDVRAALIEIQADERVESADPISYFALGLQRELPDGDPRRADFALLMCLHLNFGVEEAGNKVMYLLGVRRPGEKRLRRGLIARLVLRRRRHPGRDCEQEITQGVWKGLLKWYAGGCKREPLAFAGKSGAWARDAFLRSRDMDKPAEPGEHRDLSDDQILLRMLHSPDLDLEALLDCQPSTAERVLRRAGFTDRLVEHHLRAREVGHEAAVAEELEAKGVDVLTGRGRKKVTDLAESRHDALLKKLRAALGEGRLTLEDT